MNNSKTIHWAALITVTAALTTVQVAAAAPASAVPGLHREVGTSDIDSVSPKTARAYCPPGERVVGGGGRVESAGAFTTKLTLTQLQPIQGSGTTPDRYVVSGAETAPGFNAAWLVRAYALCAPAGSLGGYHVVNSAPTDPSSQSVQATEAACPDGQRVLGTGATVVNPGGQVALQVARASGDGRLARAQAHEEPDGYPSPWSVRSHAVCANPPAGYEVRTAESTQRLSETVKFAAVDCPDGKRVHGAGAAITDTAPAHVSLQAINTLDDLDGVQVFAVENTPTSQNWDFIVARAICAF